MANLLTGKEVVDTIRIDITERVKQLKQRGIQVCLALVRMGENPDDLSYESTAIKQAESHGITIKSYILDASAPQEKINALVGAINEDNSIHGCLMFRPLPKHINEQEVCDLLAAQKDIDGISLGSLAAVFTDDVGFAPCTAPACLALLDHYDVSLEGKHVVVIGRSLVVGKPLSMMLLHRNATVTICHSKTKNLQEVCRQADIVICATGKAKYYNHRYFRSGQTVIDVGINFDSEGNICGDVDFDEVEPIVDAITPVPRGIGSVTTSILMLNTVKAAEQSP